MVNVGKYTIHGSYGIGGFWPPIRKIFVESKWIIFARDFSVKMKNMYETTTLHGTREVTYPIQRPFPLVGYASSPEDT